MSINWQEIAFHFLGGLGLFLYSIKTMGDGLQQAAGDRLRYYIDKYTSNPFFGILVGIGMTGLSWVPILEQPSHPLSLVLNWETTHYLCSFSEQSVSSSQKIEPSITSDELSLVSVVSSLPSIL